MILLDTDVFSLLELSESRDSLGLRSRLAQLDPPVLVATTVVTYEEQSCGRLSRVNAARNEEQLVAAYRSLASHVQNYSRISVIEFDEDAAAMATALRKGKLRLGTMDLRIAAIALTRDAVLVSRNLQHFQRVPGLRVEDWTQI